MVQYSEVMHHFQDNKEDKRNVHSWVGSGPIKGVICIAHGILEHGKAYDECAQMLAKNGYAVYAIDHYGHGLSSGKRHWVDKYSDFVDDFVSFCAMVRARHSNELPFFIFGHSMGSMVSHLAVNQIPAVHAMFISGFPLHSGPGSSSLFGIRALYFLSQTSLTPWISKQLAYLDPNGDTAPLLMDSVTSDEEMKEKFRNDERRPRGVIINQMAKELTEMQTEVRKTLSYITLPIRYIHGEEDDIGYASGSKVGFETVGTVPELKSLRIYKHLLHECINEVQPARGKVLKDILEFFDAQCRRKRANGVLVDASSRGTTKRVLVQSDSAPVPAPLKDDAEEIEMHLAESTGEGDGENEDDDEDKWEKNNPALATLVSFKAAKHNAEVERIVEVND